MPTKSSKGSEKSSGKDAKKPAVKDLTPKKNPSGGRRDYPPR